MTTSDMPGDEFRRHGKALIDWIADYLEDPRKFPVTADASPGDLIRQLPEHAPAAPESMCDILRDFERQILPRTTHWNHPRFFAWFSISSSGPGILGELLIAALDINAMLWKSCPAATELEQVVVKWVLEWLELPADWFGMIVDTASNGVVQAVIAARQRAEPESRDRGPSGRLAAYVSEHTHSSIEKALIAAGIGRANVRHIPVDARFRMEADALERAIREDADRGLKPFFATATIGTTSTTAIDPVPQIAAICRKHGVWFHVDGAYGGLFGMLPECRQFLEGVDLADSFIVNPHKVMGVPIDCSLFYTRDPDIVREAFSLEAEYLNTGISDVVNYMDYGLALGRRFRALKLWFVMRHFGLAGIAEMLRRSLSMAASLANRISSSEKFELAVSPAMGLVCFHARSGDDATRELMNRINQTGSMFVSHTVLNGRFTIRVAIGNMRTEPRDVDDLWKVISGDRG